MCGVPCNDKPENYPAVELTITTRSRTSEAARHIEVRTDLTADELANQIAEVVQGRSGPGYVREVGGDR